MTTSTVIGLSAVACGGGQTVMCEVRRGVKKHQGREARQRVS